VLEMVAKRGRQGEIGNEQEAVVGPEDRRQGDDPAAGISEEAFGAGSVCQLRDRGRGEVVDKPDRVGPRR